MDPISTSYIFLQNMPQPDVCGFGSGEFLVSYTAQSESGVVLLTVAIDGGKHIYNSPFPVFVAPGEALASQSGPLPCAFTIHARDAAGNHMQDGGLAFTVNIKPVFATGVRAAKVQTEVVDLNNGVYQVSFVPQTVGHHKTTVILRDAPIRGSPF
ncbi:hypothetical protein T484DRAFT_1792900, partial [Baffinella frigidus]